jgi:hypothetical protein
VVVAALKLELKLMIISLVRKLPHEPSEVSAQVAVQNYRVSKQAALMNSEVNEHTYPDLSRMAKDYLAK